MSVNSYAFRPLKAGLVVAEVQTVGGNLRAARDAIGLTQGQLAERIGVSVVSVSAWERDQYLPTEENFRKLARALETTAAALRYGAEAPAAVREEAEVSYYRSAFVPNSALRKRLRPRPYARVYEHIEQLVTAGCSVEQIEEAERLMIDGAYNKLNARDPRDRTDEEMVMDIDDAWDWIKEVLGRSGVKGL